MSSMALDNGLYFEPPGDWRRERVFRFALGASVLIHAVLIAFVPGFRSLVIEPPMTIDVEIVTAEPPPIAQAQPVPPPAMARPQPMVEPPPPRQIEEPVVQPRIEPRRVEPAPEPLARQPEPELPRAEVQPLPRPDPRPEVAAVPEPRPEPRAEPRVEDRAEPPPVPEPRPEPVVRDVPRPLQQAEIRPPVSPQPIQPAPVVQPPPVVAVAPPPVAAEPAQRPAESAAVERSLVTSYEKSLSALVKRYEKYPPRALREKWQGTAIVQLRLSVEGDVTGFSIVESSGRAILDEAALDMFRRASPLPRAPEALRGKERTMRVPVNFRLQIS